MADIKTTNDKVFFIVSNQSKIDKYIEYQLPKKTGINSGIMKLSKVHQKEMHYKREEFIIYVYFFEIESKNLSKEKNQKAIINLKYDKTIFIGEIFFKEKTIDKIKHFNTFIYDFEFQDYQDWRGKIYHPPSVKLTKVDQLTIFHEVLKKLHIKVKDILSKTLITDSQCYINEEKKEDGKNKQGQKFPLDFYLENLKWCYTEKGIKTLLLKFNIEKVYQPQEFAKEKYFRILESIENNPDIINKHISEKDKLKDKYFKNFYTLLLYFRVNYEKEKIQGLLRNQKAKKYLIEILPKYHKFFQNLDISDEFINEMISQEGLKFEIIKGSLSYGNSIEKVLYFINKNIDLIANCCIKEEQKINMIEMANPEQKDDLNKIIDEIEKILNYQKQIQKVFVLFDENFWTNYIHFNDNNNLNNLILIKKAILLCKEGDKKLDYEKLNLELKIHNTGIISILKEKLKNESLIDFIQNKDLYFKDKKYSSKKYRPLEILQGIDLDSADEKFLEIWKNSEIFKIYSFCDYEFKKELINKVTDMKDFGKLLKLFDYNDNKIFDTNTSQLLRERFKNIITTYQAEKCPHFIEDISLYIYIIDKINRNNKDIIKKFMENTIEKYIQSVETVNEVYLYLISKYKDITKTLIDCIANYFTKNKDKLNGESILFLLKKLNSKEIVKSILNKINSCVINEIQLFNEEKDIDTFKLLSGIQKEELLNKFPELTKTNYFVSTLELSNKILRKIEIGEIKCKSINSFLRNQEKKRLLNERLNIILFNNKDDVEKCLKIFDTKFKQYIKAQVNLKILHGVLSDFYEITFQKDLKLLDELQNKMNTGTINLIENIQRELDIIKNKIPDLDKKCKLKTSLFFTYFYKTNKSKKLAKKEEDIFNETEEDFKKLKSFFEKDWFKNIDEIIIKECYKSLRGKEKQDIYKELKLLRDYFGLKEYKDLDLEKLQDEIKIFSTKI